MSDQGTQVLVTGAAGFLGTQVVKTLLEAGYKVRGTVRSTKNEAKIKHLRNLCPNAAHPEVELVEADLLKEEGWMEAVSGCTYVHHVASPYVLDKVRHEDELIKPAVDGTLVVLRACAKAGTVKRVVLTSSAVAVVSIGGNEVPFSEKDWADPNAPNRPPYFKSKILAERAAWDFVESLAAGEKFELAVVNPYAIFGPALHTTPGASTTTMKRILERDYPSIPKIWVNVVDVRDVALAHLRCQEVAEAAGNRHIIETKGMWMTELAAILNREFQQYGYRVPTGEMPGFIYTIATWFDTTLKQVRATTSLPITVDTSRMRNVLNITPIDPEKTLIDMAYSLIDEGFVKKTEQYKRRKQ